MKGKVAGPLSPRSRCWDPGGEQTVEQRNRRWEQLLLVCRDTNQCDSEPFRSSVTTADKCIATRNIETKRSQSQSSEVAMDCPCQTVRSLCPGSTITARSVEQGMGPEQALSSGPTGEPGRSGGQGSSQTSWRRLIPRRVHCLTGSGVRLENLLLGLLQVTEFGPDGSEALKAESVSCRLDLLSDGPER